MSLLTRRSKGTEAVSARKRLSMPQSDAGRCADLLNHYFLFYNKIYDLLRNIDLLHDVSGDLSFYRSFTCSDRILFCDISRNHDDRFTLPFTCTATSISSSFIASSSHSGHVAWNTLSVPPSSLQSSSPRCGVNGASKITKVFKVSLSIPPSFFATSVSLLQYSMNPDTTVFRLNWLKRVSIS